MQASLILLFLYLIITFIGIFATTRHLFKTLISMILSVGIVLLYVYIDRITNTFSFRKIVTDINSYFESGYNFLNIVEKDRLILSQITFLFTFYFICFVIIFILISFVPIGFSTMDSGLCVKKAVFSIIYIVVVGLFTTYLFSNIAPIFNVKYGFMSNVFKYMEVLFI